MPVYQVINKRINFRPTILPIEKNRNFAFVKAMICNIYMTIRLHA